MRPQPGQLIRFDPVDLHDRRPASPLGNPEIEGQAAWIALIERTCLRTVFQAGKPRAEPQPEQPAGPGQGFDGSEKIPAGSGRTEQSHVVTGAREPPAYLPDV